MHTLVVPELDRRLAARGSPYAIRWTEAYGGSLYKYGETLEGIQIGLTDMGWVGTLWELSKLPLQNVTFYAPFASDDFRLVVDIVNEMHRTVPAMTDAWTAQNVKFLGASALDTYHLMTTFPVGCVDDLRGRKILAPGPSAAWLEGTGAVAVDGSLTTYYQQIQTGVADGVITILTGAAPNRLHEVAPYITLVGLGSQVTGALAINLDTWNRLPDDVRAELERARARVQPRRRRRYREALRREHRAHAQRRRDGHRVPARREAEVARRDARHRGPLDRGDGAPRSSRRRSAARVHERAARARRAAAARLGSRSLTALPASCRARSRHGEHARPTLFATLVGVLNAAGVVWVFALMFLISADIAARTVFDDPIAGVTEMVSLSLVACVFLQLAHAVLHGRLMRVEMFLTPLEQRAPAAASAWRALFALLGVGAASSRSCSARGPISSAPGRRASSPASKASSRCPCGPSSS